MKFLTKFTLHKRKLPLMDWHNNVDRLSYVENSVLIRRSMEAGKQLRINNSQCDFNNYHDVFANKSNVVESPYPEDPTIVSDKMSALSEEIELELSVKGNVKAVEHSETAGTLPSDNSAQDTPKE